MNVTSSPFAWRFLVKVVVVVLSSEKGDRKVAICSVVSFLFRAAGAAADPDGVVAVFASMLNSGRRIGVGVGVDDGVDVAEDSDGVGTFRSGAESREVVAFLTFDFFDRETFGMIMEELSSSSLVLLLLLLLLLLSISLRDMSTFFFFFFRGDLIGSVVTVSRRRLSSSTVLRVRTVAPRDLDRRPGLEDFWVFLRCSLSNFFSTRALSCCSLALTISCASCNCLCRSLPVSFVEEEVAVVFIVNVVVAGLSLVGFRPFRTVVGEEEVPFLVLCNRSWWDPPPIVTPMSTPFRLPVEPALVVVEGIPIRPSLVLCVVLVGVVGGCEGESSCGCFFFFFFVLLLLQMLLWVVFILMGCSTNRETETPVIVMVMSSSSCYGGCRWRW